jgi:hypothetical protein
MVVWVSGLYQEFAKLSSPLDGDRWFESSRNRHFMKVLERKDINKVKLKFQIAVLEAWKRGEEVPYGVIHLSDAPLTEKDIEWAKKNIEKFELGD